MSAKAGPRDVGFGIVRGDRRCAAEYAGVRVVVARNDDAPFSVDAAAFEEDTWLALSADTDTVIHPGHPVRVMTRVWNSQPRKPGSVFVAAGQPTRLLAIVHDLDHEPSWTNEWVEQALAAVLRAAVEQRCRSLKLPLLGTKHGRLPPLEFVEMLRRALPSALASATDPPPLRRIWLAREQESGAELLQALTRTGAGG